MVYDSMTGNKIGPLSRKGNHSLDKQHIAYHRNLWIDVGQKGL